MEGICPHHKAVNGCFSREAQRSLYSAAQRAHPRRQRPLQQYKPLGRLSTPLHTPPNPHWFLLKAEAVCVHLATRQGSSANSFVLLPHKPLRPLDTHMKPLM